MRELGSVLACAALCAASGAFSAPAFAAAPEANTAAALHAKYAALRSQLGSTQFQRPLVLESAESEDASRGDIYALVEYPFAAVSAALDTAADWCDVVILHLNTKYCRASTKGSGSSLAIRAGRKFEEPLADTYRMDFSFNVAAAAPDYLRVALEAESGPLGTSNYRILLEAIPVDRGRTFLHFTYAYSSGLAARIAMQGYLATIGRRKVGFTVVGHEVGGQPEYIGGARGVVERNTMRYYLAIDAHLGAFIAPAGERFERRLQLWFTGTERYHRQLHEVERAAYLEMKRGDFALRPAISQGVPEATVIAR